MVDNPRSKYTDFHSCFLVTWSIPPRLVTSVYSFHKFKSRKPREGIFVIGWPLASMNLYSMRVKSRSSVLVYTFSMDVIEPVLIGNEEVNAAVDAGS